MTTVYDLSKSDGSNATEYSCSAIEAVIAAYAQSKNDYNTWDYSHKYSHLVVVAPISVCIGDFSAFRDDITLEERNTRFRVIHAKARKIIEDYQNENL